MDYTQLADELEEAAKAHHRAQHEAFMVAHLQGQANFHEVTPAKFWSSMVYERTVSWSLRRACVNSQEASRVLLFVVRTCGDRHEVRDPNSGRTFLVIRYRGIDYIQEEIEK